MANPPTRPPPLIDSDPDPVDCPLNISAGMGFDAKKSDALGKGPSRDPRVDPVADQQTNSSTLTRDLPKEKISQATASVDDDPSNARDLPKLKISQATASVDDDPSSARDLPKENISQAIASVGDDPSITRSASKNDPYQVSASVDDLSGIRNHNVIQRFVSQFLALPMKNSANSILKRPSVGMEGGFLNYFSQNSMFLSFSSDQEEPSTFQKISTWMKDNLVPGEAERKAFVMMVLEMNGLQNEMCIGPAMFRGRHVLLSIGRIQSSVKQIQKQLVKVQKSATNTEAITQEGVEILKEIRDLIAEGHTIAKILQENAGKEVEASFLAELTAKVHKFNNSDLVKLLKEVDAAVNNVANPFSYRERFNKVKVELLLLSTFLNSLSNTLSNIKGGVKEEPSAENAQPDPSAEKSQPDPSAEKGQPDPSAEKTQPDLSAEKAKSKSNLSGPIPFSYLGKVAKDVLYKDYDLGALHADLRCKLNYGLKRDPTLFFKICSKPASVKAVIKQSHLFGCDMTGALSFLLPYADNTSKAKVQFLHERLALNARLGLYSEPHLTIAAMVGSSRAAAGGQLGFNTKNGAIFDLSVGATVTDSELGTISTMFKLTDKGKVDLKHGSYKAVYSKSHGSTTFAAEMVYKLVEKSGVKPEHTVVGAAGVLHQYDSGLMVKAKMSTTGEAAAMIQFSGGPGGSIVRGTVSVDLHKLRQEPKVGVSISLGPTE